MDEMRPVSELKTAEGKREMDRMLAMGVAQDDIAFMIGEIGQEIVLINKKALITLIKASPLGREVAFRRIRDGLGAAYHFTLEDEAAIFC